MLMGQLRFICPRMGPTLSESGTEGTFQLRDLARPIAS
jgi:hypothetical protein